MLKTKNNVAAAQSILAIARAYAMMPGADRARSAELAEKIDRVLAEGRQMDGFVALAIVMLKQLGVPDAPTLTGARSN